MSPAPDDEAARKEARLANAVMAFGLTAGLALLITFFVYESKHMPDYDVLAPRVEKQLNGLYTEDVDVYVHTGRGQSFITVVDGEQAGCTVWNPREMWDDPDVGADVRCRATEEWPFTPEPEKPARPDADPTSSPAPSETPTLNPIPTDPFADLVD